MKKINFEYNNRWLLAFILLIFYIFSIMFDLCISYNECKNNDNFYNEELNKGFSDLCQMKDRDNLILIIFTILEPILAIGLYCIYYPKLFKNNLMFFLIIFVFTYKITIHIAGGFSWLI